MHASPWPHGGVLRTRNGDAPKWPTCFALAGVSEALVSDPERVTLPANGVIRLGPSASEALKELPLADQFDLAVGDEEIDQLAPP